MNNAKRAGTAIVLCCLLIILGVATVSAAPAPQTLNVDLTGSFPAQIRVEIHEDDSTSNSATGALVAGYNNQAGGDRFYTVDAAVYDVVLIQGPKSLIIDHVDCSAEDCNVGDVVTTLSVDLSGSFPSQVRVELYVEDGGFIWGVNNQAGAVRSYNVLTNTYDVKFVQGPKELLEESWDCTNDTACEARDVTETLTVDLDGIWVSQIRVELHIDDETGGTAGAEIWGVNNEAEDIRTYTVLKNKYDIVLEQGPKVKIVDAVDCTSAATCNAGDIITTLTVDLSGNFPSQVRVELLTENGDFIWGSNNQAGELRTYNVLSNTYDVRLVQGPKSLYEDNWVCTAVDNCETRDVTETLTVDLSGSWVSQIRVELHLDDTNPPTAGAEIWGATNQAGDVRTYAVLKNNYDVVLVQGPKVKIVDVDCTSAPTCNAGDVITTLTVDLSGNFPAQVRVELLTQDGAFIWGSNNQAGASRTYNVLSNIYDVKLVQGPKVVTEDDWICTAVDDCELRDVTETLSVDLSGSWLSQIRVELHKNDGSPGDFIWGVNNQAGDLRTYTVLENTYDVVLVQGPKVKTVEEVDCEGGGCDAGDVISELTVDMTGFGNMRVELHKDDAATGTAGPIIWGANNQNGVNTYQVLKNHYDVLLQFGGNDYLWDAVDCTGETCVLDQSTLTVEIPGLMGVRVEVRQDDGNAGTASGTLVTYKNNQSGSAVFPGLDNGIYDIVLKQGAKTKIVDAVIVLGSNVKVTGIVATLTVDLEGMSGVRVEVRTDDAAAGTAGGLVFYHNNQAGLKTYAVLKNSYDLVLIKGAKSKLVDAVDCYSDPCTAGDIVAPLSVNYEGMTGVRIEVRTDDGDDDNSAGGLVFYHNNQSGTKSYDVLKNNYDLVFIKGAKVKHVDVDCTGVSCDAGDIVATLTVNYEGMTGVRIEVRTDNGDNDNSAGGLVFYHNNQSGTKSYDVLKNNYDLVFIKGAKVKHVDVDCHDDCNAGDIIATMTVDYENMSGVRIEVRTDDGNAGTAGGLVFYHNNQNNVRTYDVLKNTYDLVFKKGAKTKIVDSVDCTSNTCSPGDIVATMTVDYENMSGVRMEVRTDDGNVGTAGNLVFYHNNQSGVRQYDVLKNTYDLVFKKGAKTKIVDSVDCTSNTCSPGDIVATLTVDYGSLTGVRIEVRTNDGASGTAGGLVFYHNNQSGVRNYDVLKNFYDIKFIKGAATALVDAVNCTGNTCSLGSSNMVIKAPSGTAVKIKQDGSGTVVATGTLPSSRSRTFSNIPIGVYDIELTQGAGTVVVENLFHVGGSTVDMLNTLTVKGPSGTQIKVQTAGGGALTSGSMPSSRSTVLYTLRSNLWKLYLKQGAGETITAMDNSGATTLVDRLTTLTVIAPSGTIAAVQTSAGANLVSGSLPSGRSIVLYVLRNDGLDTTPDWKLSLTQGAGNIVIDPMSADEATESQDHLHILTVEAPSGTAAKVQTSGGGVLTSGSLPSSRSMVLYTLKHTAWELYLKQGDGETTIAMDNSAASTTVNRLNTLTVEAPSGTVVKVQTFDGTGELTSGSMPSSRSMGLYVLRNDGLDAAADWRLHLTQGAGTVIQALDASTATTLVEQLNTLTVKAPSGTAVQVQNSAGSVVTSGSMPSSRSRVLYVLRVPDPGWKLYMVQGSSAVTQEPQTDMSNSGPTTLAERLCTVTVTGPSGTAVAFTLGGNAAASGSLPSSGSRVFYVVRQVSSGTSYDVNGKSVDCSGPTASVSLP